MRDRAAPDLAAFDPAASRVPADGAGALASISRRLRAVRRRIHLNRFLAALFLDLLVAFSLFLAFLVTDRLVDTPLEPLPVLAVLAGGALCVSLVRGAILGRVTLFRTAILTDGALGLGERVSSAVWLAGGREAAAPGAAGWNEAVEVDGARWLSRVDPRRAFPVRLPRSAPWLLGVVAATVAVALTLGQHDLLGWGASRVAEARMKKELEAEVKKVAESEEFKELEKLADRKDDPELARLLEALRKPPAERPEDAAKTATDVRPEKSAAETVKERAILKMNRLAEAIRARAKKKDFRKLRTFLEKMRAMKISRDATLTRSLQQALKDGDLSRAGKELSSLLDRLKALEEKLRQGKQLTKEEQDLLRKLREELAALARKKPGLLARLGDGLDAFSANLSREELERMMKDLESDLERFGDDLESLARQLAELETLEQTVELVRLARERMGEMHRCPNCGGLRLGPPQPGGT